MFTITLSSGYSQEFKRMEFMSYFYDSMIGTALDDPEATDINITHPSVTPGILKLLSEMASTGVIPSTIPRKEDLVTAS